MNSEIDLQTGTTVRLTTDEAYANKTTKDNIYVDYKNIVKVITVGKRVFIDDGLISLLVKKVG